VSMSEPRIPIGSMARDTITGFKGVVIGRSEYLHGCVHVCIQPKELDKDGQPKKSKWFDEPQLEPVPSKKRHKRTGDTGGPRDNHPPARDHGPER